jgi:DNA-binding CsgD family transcriptional regulator
LTDSPVAAPGEAAGDTRDSDDLIGLRRTAKYRNRRGREVAGLVASGRTSKDIAASLYLSGKTIESHLARIYDKLDVHSRAALIAVIVREGGG